MIPHNDHDKDCAQIDQNELQDEVFFHVEGYVDQQYVPQVVAKWVQKRPVTSDFVVEFTEGKSTSALRLLTFKFSCLVESEDEDWNDEGMECANHHQEDS